MDGVASALDGAGALTAVVGIVLGLVVCFAGYRLIRVAFGICGFILGAALGALLAGQLGHGDTNVVWIAGLIGGLVGAGLSMILYKLGVFIVGAAAGMVLGGMVGSGLEGNQRLIAVVLGAILVGILALVVQRLVIIIATAISGSWLVAQVGAALLSGNSLAWKDLFSRSFVPQVAGAALVGFVVGWVMLGIAGAVVQFRRKK
jgi:hypothetical protein